MPSQNECYTKEMRGGCLAITGNISEKTNMCNLGNLSMMIKEADHKKKKKKFTFSQFAGHCHMFYSVSPFHRTA